MGRPTRRPVGEQGAPVHRDAVRPELAERLREPGPAALVAAQGARHHDGAARLLRGVLDSRGQNGVRTALDEYAVPVGKEGLDGFLEPHGVAQILEPVRGVQVLARYGRGTHRGVERDPTLARADFGQDGGEFLTQLLDLGAVRGVIHRDLPGPHLLLGTLRQQFLQGLRFA